MNREMFLYFFDEDVEGTRQLLDALNTIQSDFWRQEPEGMFGPGEEFVHTVQSGIFACRFIREQLELDPATELEEHFKRAAFNPDALMQLNLRGARKVRRMLQSCGLLREWVLNEYQAIRFKLEGIPEDLYDRPVSHPLVHMAGPCGVILVKMFTRHWPYHYGQLTQQMKAAGFREHVPFLLHFGRFEEVPATEG